MKLEVTFHFHLPLLNFALLGFLSINDTHETLGEDCVGDFKESSTLKSSLNLLSIRFGFQKNYLSETIKSDTGSLLQALHLT